MTRFWSGIPSRMPRQLPPPIPELAFVVRFLLRHVGWINSPRWDFIFNYLLHVSVLRRLPDKRLLFNDVLFRIKTGPLLKSALAAYVSDKEFVKRHIAEVVGEKYNVPTLAILKTVEEIDAYDFPKRCVIKPTHASGEFIPRRAGEPLDVKRIKGWLRLDYSEQSCEANYRNLVPKIIVEPWVFDTAEFSEFSILCVEGKARFILASSDRFTNQSVAYFDIEWNELSYRSNQVGHRRFDKPKHLQEILSTAERLAKDFFIVRVDTYYDGTTIKCGEITNCPRAGLIIYEPRDGELLQSRLLFSDTPHEVWDRFFDEQSISA